MASRAPRALSLEAVNEPTMERYLAWGNARHAAGKNWYTDIVQLMRAAPVLLPGRWPRIALDKRAARRIRYKQAPDDPRNRLYASREGANRAAPPEALAPPWRPGSMNCLNLSRQSS